METTLTWLTYYMFLGRRFLSQNIQWHPDWQLNHNDPSVISIKILFVKKNGWTYKTLLGLTGVAQVLSTQLYGLSYILVEYFNVISLQVWVNVSQWNMICNPTDPSDFQKSERCSRFTWLFMPQSTMEGLVNHNAAICVSQDVEANIHSGSQFSTQLLLSREEPHHHTLKTGITNRSAAILSGARKSEPAAIRLAARRSPCLWLAESRPRLGMDSKVEVDSSEGQSV